jgi:hypothetical protein
VKGWRGTAILAAITVLVLTLSVPGSLRSAVDPGGFSVFSREFLSSIYFTV